MAIANTAENRSSQGTLNDNTELRLRKASEASRSVLADSRYSTRGWMESVTTAAIFAKISSIPAHELENMSPVSGELQRHATSALNEVTSTMTKEQQAAAQNGGHPANRVEAMQAATALGVINEFFRVAHQRSEEEKPVSSASPRSGMAYEDLVAFGSPQFWRTAKGEFLMSDYARSVNLGWACGLKEILHMGPVAIKTLADAHLEKETYTKMKDAGASGKDVVSVARYANETGADANKLGNEVAKTVNEIEPENSPRKQAVWGAISKYLDSYKKENTPEQKRQNEAASENYKKFVQEKYGHDPQKAQKIMGLKKKINDAKTENVAKKQEDAKLTDENSKLTHEKDRLAKDDKDINALIAARKPIPAGKGQPAKAPRPN